MSQTTKEEVMSNEATAVASSTLKRLMKLGKPYLGWYIVLCLIAAVVSLANVAVAEALRRIINAATHQDISGLMSALIFGCVIFIVEAAGNFLNTLLTGQLEFKSTAKLQASVLSKLLKVQMKNLDHYHSADLISRMNDSAPAAQQGINQKTIELLSNLMQITFLLTYLLSLQYVLTLGVLIICSLVPLVMIPFTSRLRFMHERRQQVETAQQVFIQDTIQGAEVVRSFSLASKLRDQFAQRVKQYFNIHIPVSRIEAVGYNMPLAVILFGLLYVLSYGGYLVMDGRLDVGAVAAFLICFEQITNPVSRLANLWTEFQASLAQGNRLFEVLDLKEEGRDHESVFHGDSTDKSTANSHSAVDGFHTISFEQVSFRYGDDPILTDVSLTIEPGKVTAFAGPSGSGKSTIINLLLAMYEPHEGIIRCGDMLLDDIHPQVWRHDIAYVSQEPYLFSGTLYENIAWGRPSAIQEDIIKAAQNAGIHEFIMATPQQYETVIGERGLTLSGGERQRLSIARAFVRMPKLLLLDEPTAALDSHNEEIVQQALKVLMYGRTTVVIAHRLSTIRDADRIYYMESGSIVEEGSHHELMKLDGKYRAMVETTFKQENISTEVMEVEP